MNNSIKKIVTKYVNPQFADIELLIQYIEEHEVIDKKVFKTTLNKNYFKNVKYNFLHHFKSISRDQFIKRIPIYYYDTNITSKYKGAIAAFFGEVDYSEKSNKENYLYNLYERESFFEKKPKSTYYEETYKVLDVILSFYISFDQMFDYLIKQIGDISRFDILEKWTQYLLLIQNTDNTNYFPNNILYALNVELIKNNKEPIIYRIHNPQISYLSVSIKGEFPIDDNYKPVLKWIAIWMSNVETEKIDVDEWYDVVMMSDASFKYMHPELLNIIIIKTNVNSKIFLLYGNEWRGVYNNLSPIKLNLEWFQPDRKFMRYNEKEIADLIGMDIKDYQDFLAGKASIDGVSLIKLTRILGMGGLIINRIIKKEVIEDKNLQKFKSNKSLECFLNYEDDEAD